MRKKLWLRGVALSFGALVVVVAVSGLVSCANLFGSDDDGGGGGGGTADVDPTGTWLVVLDTAAEGPTGEDFQAALAEIDDTQFAIVFYGQDTAQLAGLKGSYEVYGDTVNCLMNIGWFPEDPSGDSNTPELKGTWDAIDWYEVVEDDAMELSVTIDGTTLFGGGEGEIEFEKVSFSRPLDLLNKWVNGDDDVELHGTGIWTYTYGTQTGGGPSWEASGTTEGFLRQVYDEISDESVNYMEYLSPHEMPDASSLRFYDEYDLPTDAFLEYTASE